MNRTIEPTFLILSHTVVVRMPTPLKMKDFNLQSFSIPTRISIRSCSRFPKILKNNTKHSRRAINSNNSIKNNQTLGKMRSQSHTGRKMISRIRVWATISPHKMSEPSTSNSISSISANTTSQRSFKATVDRCPFVRNINTNTMCRNRMTQAMTLMAATRTSTGWHLQLTRADCTSSSWVASTHLRS